LNVFNFQAYNRITKISLNFMMKTKTPIKILTLTLFFTLISGFTLYKGGYLFSDEKKAAYISDPNGGTEVELKKLADEDFGLNTFQRLKLKGAFDPKYFDTLYGGPVFISGGEHFLSSSKSAVIVNYGHFKNPFALYDSFLSILLSQQFDTIKSVQKK